MLKMMFQEFAYMAGVYGSGSNVPNYLVETGSIATDAWVDAGDVWQHFGFSKRVTLRVCMAIMLVRNAG
jgi:hypothetical protein